MTYERFWEIVEELNWPNVHYDRASRQFMEKYSVEEADAFHDIFLRLKGELRKSAAVTEVSDSMDDALAHTIGLGKTEYECYGSRRYSPETVPTVSRGSRGLRATRRKGLAACR